MNKRILNISFWLLSAFVFYYINIHLLWHNQKGAITHYQWGNSYANEPRNYFLFDGINASNARDWEYFNYNDEPIYFEDFDYLIKSNNEPYSLMSTHQRCRERGFCNLDGHCPYSRNCSVPFSINNFTGEAIKLHISHCDKGDEPGHGDCQFIWGRSGPIDYSGGVTTSRFYTFLDVYDRDSSKWIDSSVIDQKLKYHQLKSNNISSNNIKCKMSFKNGKAHGKKIIYNDPAFYISDFGIKKWNDHLHFYRNYNTKIRIPYFIINSLFKYKNQSENKYTFSTDSIIETYNEGLLSDLEIWRTNCTFTHSTTLVKNASILSPPKIQLEIIKSGKSIINYRFKNYDKQNKDLKTYNIPFEYLDEKLTFNFTKPTLIHESHNEKGVLNSHQLDFKENEYKTKPNFKISWEFLNNYIDIKAYLLFYIFGQSILVFAYYLIRKKLLKN
jgi:hypothetical protein